MGYHTRRIRGSRREYLRALSALLAIVCFEPMLFIRNILPAKRYARRSVRVLLPTPMPWQGGEQNTSTEI